MFASWINDKKAKSQISLPGEDVKLKVRDVVIAREVYGGLEGHGLQPRADAVHLVQSQSEHFPGNYSPLTKTSSPEICGVTFGNSEGVPREHPLGEHGLQLAEHVAEHQAELRQVAPVVRIFVEQLLLPLFK